MHCGPRQRKRRRKQQGGILPLLIPAAVAAAVLMKRKKKKKKKVGKISAANQRLVQRRVQRMFNRMPGWGGFETMKRL